MTPLVIGTNAILGILVHATDGNPSVFRNQADQSLTNVLYVIVLLQQARSVLNNLGFVGAEMRQLAQNGNLLVRGIRLSI